jgi:hypothetical protein
MSFCTTTRTSSAEVQQGDGNTVAAMLPAHVRFHPIQRGPVYPEAAGHIHDGVPGVQSLVRLAALMRGQLERSAETNAANFCP